MKTFVSKSFLSVDWPFSERKYTQEGLLTDFVEQHSLLSFLFFFSNFSLKFVVDHAAKPEIKEGKIDAWKKGMQILSQNPNVFCKM